MPIAQTLLPEFDHEMATTRTLLERVPDGKGDWKPHERSMALGYLANHIATLPQYANTALEGTEMDMNPPGGKKYQMAEFNSVQERLAAFDTGVKRAREAIAATPDSDMHVMWSLKNGGETMLSLPRVAVLRSFMMNHLIHHRGQLSVYLRLLDVPLPSIYGPTADTPM
ncbi:MAG: DinB family protein [Gemmatimonadaceae bacterium]